MENEIEVVVYTKPNCMQCKSTTRWLDKNNIPYRTEDAGRAVDQLKAQGFSSVPVVMVNRGGDQIKAWSGYRPDQLKSVPPLFKPSDNDAVLTEWYWTGGVPRYRIWKDNQGRVHNSDGAAFEQFCENGQLFKEQHVNHGRVLDERVFYDDNNWREESYAYHSDGTLKEVRRTKNGALDGARCVERYDNRGKAIYIESWSEGKMIYSGAPPVRKNRPPNPVRPRPIPQPGLAM